MSETPIWNKKVCCKMNKDFISIRAYSGYHSAIVDPKAKEYLMGLNVDNIILGQAIIQSLEQSRFLILEEMYEYNDLENLKKNYDAWIEKIKKIYGYKTKRAMFGKMDSCRVELKGDHIIISPSYHEKLEAWGGGNGQITEADNVIIPADSSPEQIGEALRLAFSRCKGRYW